MQVPADIHHLEDQLDAAERDAQALVQIERTTGRVARRARLLERGGVPRPSGDREPCVSPRDDVCRGPRPGSEQAATRPGRAWLHRALVRALARAAGEAAIEEQGAAAIRPRTAPPLADAFAAFMSSQQHVLAFLRAGADLDLTGVRFPNPFVRGVRFSLATGLHVIAAHERRHLWQAWRVRQAAERRQTDD